MKRKSIIFVGVILVIIFASIIINYSGKEELIDIKTPVKKGYFEVSITTTGELRAENFELIRGPFVRKIGVYNLKIVDLVPEGTVVDSGDFVASLDRTEITSKYDEVEDQVQKQQSQYDKTQLDTALALRQLRDNLINLRYTLEENEITLDQSKYESPATIRQAKINLEKAERGYNQSLDNYGLIVEQKEAEMLEVSINLSQRQRRLSDIKDVMGDFDIYAPKSGMVIYFKEWGGQKRKVGSEFNPWNPTVATLPDMSSMISKTYVNEIDISNVRVGQEVLVGIDAFPDRSYSGAVTEVANVGEDLPNSDAKVFEVVIVVNESDTILKPNMTSSNTIVASQHEDVLYISLDAIYNNDSLTYVYLDKFSTIVKQVIEVGPSNENNIIVKRGLNENDMVYLSQPANHDNLKYEGLAIYEDLKVKRELERQKAAELKKLKSKQDSSKKKDMKFSVEGLDISKVSKKEFSKANKSSKSRKKRN